MTVARSITKIAFVADIDATSTGDTVLIRPVKPLDILRWGFISQATVDVGVGAEFGLDHRPTIASDTGRTEIAAISVSADVAAGKGQYDDLADAVAAATGIDGSTVYTGSSNPFKVDPGEEVVFEVKNAADTGGTVLGFIEYYEEPFVGTRVSTNMTDVG